MLVPSYCKAEGNEDISAWWCEDLKDNMLIDYRRPSFGKFRFGRESDCQIACDILNKLDYENITDQEMQQAVLPNLQW